MPDDPKMAGTADYIRVNIALFLGGFATFSLLYCTQPLLPIFAAAYHISPKTSSLAVSLTTGTLAPTVFFSGALAEIVGRRRLMILSLLLASLCNVASGLVNSWDFLLVWRALEGVALGGVPAVAMSYLADEIAPADLGHAMGLYVGGTAFGGMAGRTLAPLLSESFGAEAALVQIGVLALCVSVAFALLLPRERTFAPQMHRSVSQHLTAWGDHLKDPSLRWLFVLGGLALGSLITVFNYIGFRLEGPPYYLSPHETAWIFLTYLAGVFVSPLAGRLGDRWGRRAVLLSAVGVWLVGLALTFAHQMAMVILGVALISGGFFATQSTASAWVGHMAKQHKGHAASLYMLVYYLGSSVMGYAGGWFWIRYGWAGVAAFTAAAMLGVAVIGAKLRRAE